MRVWGGLGLIVALPAVQGLVWVWCRKETPNSFIDKACHGLGAVKFPRLSSPPVHCRIVRVLGPWHVNITSGEESCFGSYFKLRSPVLGTTGKVGGMGESLREAHHPVPRSCEVLSQ